MSTQLRNAGDFNQSIINPERICRHIWNFGNRFYIENGSWETGTTKGSETAEFLCAEQALEEIATRGGEVGDLEIEVSTHPLDLVVEGADVHGNTRQRWGKTVVKQAEKVKGGSVPE
jgi:hypothetical protein